MTDSADDLRPRIDTMSDSGAEPPAESASSSSALPADGTGPIVCAGVQRRRATDALAIDEATGLPRPLAAAHAFFSSWRFPVLMMAIMAGLEVFQLAMLVVPKSAMGIGAFAEEFRVWCYGLDQETGRLEFGYVSVFLAQPAVMFGVLAFIWWKPVKEIWQTSRRAMLPYFAVAGVLVTAVFVSLISVGSKTAAAAAEPFPAVALRTAKPAPAVKLTDQDGVSVELASLKGKVVVVTGIYATCFHTCPLIMAQLKRALEQLPKADRDNVRVLAVTLNPEHDTQKVMLKTAARYQVKAPEYRLLSGDPSEVDHTLDLLEIARSKNPMSGEIDHANLFIVVDKLGQVAYRLTLGERQERWLTDALKLLLREPAA